MSTFDQLASLLLTAERASADRAVTLDLFPRGDDVAGSSALAPLWPSEAPIGRIVAERGRVCWVMTKGGNRTLSDIFSGDTGIPRDRFEALFQAARDELVPFGEKLAASGLLPVEQIRQTLRKQAGSALAALAKLHAEEEAAISIVSIPRVSYDASLTFGPMELLEAAVQESPELSRERGSLPPTYSRMAPKLRAAICYRDPARSGGTPVPVSCWGRGGMAIGETVELGPVARAAARPASPLRASIGPFALIEPQPDECWLCVYEAPHLCVFRVTSRDEYLRIVSSLANERTSTQGA